MRTKTLLLSVAMVCSLTLSAAKITVTSGVEGAGSLREAIASAVDGDIINFEIEGTNDLLLTDAITMKNITIDGTNALNGSRIVFKQTIAGKNFFTLATGVTATFKNMIFDGSAGATKICITAVIGSTLNINNCVFKNISSGSDNGGAGRLQGVANISNTLFENNTCSGTYGGGALCIYNAADVSIDKCSFINNSSTGGGNRGGGAIVARGTVAGDCNVKITNSTFANNSSSSTGGAIMSSVQSTSNFNANITAVNCTFTGNQGEGAVSALTTQSGTSKVNLINCLVVNNVNAALAYSDLNATAATEAGVATIDARNVIYSVATDATVTSSTNCIKVADPNTAIIFKGLETFATDKKRPVLTTLNNNQVALISSTSIANNAGVATLEGFTIPTVDQLGVKRPAKPSIGAVEYKLLDAVDKTLINNNIKLNVQGKLLSFTGLNAETEMSVYGMTGNLLDKRIVNNNTTITLDNLSSNLVIVRIQNQSFKVLLK